MTQNGQRFQNTIIINNSSGTYSGSSGSSSSSSDPNENLLELEIYPLYQPGTQIPQTPFQAQQDFLTTSNNSASTFIPSLDFQHPPYSSSSSSFGAGDINISERGRSRGLSILSPDSKINRRLHRASISTESESEYLSPTQKAFETASRAYGLPSASKSIEKNESNSKDLFEEASKEKFKTGFRRPSASELLGSFLNDVLPLGTQGTPTSPKKSSYDSTLKRLQQELKRFIGQYHVESPHSPKKIESGLPSRAVYGGSIKSVQLKNHSLERWKRAQTGNLHLRIHDQKRRQRLRILFFNSTCIIICAIFFLSLSIVYFLGRPRILLHKFQSQIGGGSLQSFIDQPEKNTLYIYRIIGNDLPPRHSADQTLRNLKFLLEKEVGFDGLPSIAQGSGKLSPMSYIKKIFVVNRISNSTQLDNIVNLLLENGISSDEIIINWFDLSDYRSRSFNLSPEVVRNPVWGLENNRSLQNSEGDDSIEKDQRDSTISKLRALDFTYHDKNIYAMNNNGGRNFALEHGRKQLNARWILPLDGNSFFTPAAMLSLIESLREAELAATPPSHVIIPMSRLLDNFEALAQNQMVGESYSTNQPKLNKLRPNSPEEPQIGFRFSSKENFSSQMRYGRRSKLELLWRLGAIERTRNLDKRLSGGEFSEKNLVTPESYGSVKRISSICSLNEKTKKIILKKKDTGAFVGSNKNSSDDCFQTVVQEDFIQAGWVLRLFSGDQSQEIHSRSAIVRRSINRMKGIILFLENLDEIVAREGQFRAGGQGKLGFDSSRLWTLDGSELLKIKKFTKLREEFHGHYSGVAETLERLKPLWSAHMRFAKSVLDGEIEARDRSNELEEISKTVFVLALADYLTRDHNFGEAAAGLLKLKFLDHQHFASTRNRYLLERWRAELTRIRVQTDYDGIGYAFPMPRHGGSLPKWLEDPEIEELPFNPKTFDPTLILDGIRLLSSDWQEEEESTVLDDVMLESLKNLFRIQTGILLLDEEIVHDQSLESDNKSEILSYDIKLSGLASFIDDARLLGRIASRSLIRLPLLIADTSSQKEKNIMIELYQSFKTGFNNIKFHPYDEESNQPTLNGKSVNKIEASLVLGKTSSLASKSANYPADDFESDPLIPESLLDLQPLISVINNRFKYNHHLHHLQLQRHYSSHQ